LAGELEEWRLAGAELARRSRAAQGLPDKITDPVVLQHAMKVLRIGDDEVVAPQSAA
jgi:hypothetical protein